MRRNTVAAFMPMMFVPGMMGKIFRVIPFVVIPCLLFSLLESLGILPAHLSHVPRRGRPGLWRRFQSLFSNGLKLFVRRIYTPLLEAALQWRYVTAAVGLSTLILTGGMALGGWVNFQFFPSIEADFMSASVTMPQGTPVDATSRAVARLEEGASRLRARLLQETGIDYFRHVSAAIGDQPMVGAGDVPTGPAASLASPNVGEVTVERLPAETRNLTSEQLGNLWRGGHRPDSGGGRGQLLHVDHGPGRRRRRAARGTRHRPAARCRRRAQGPPGGVRRPLRDLRFLPRRQGGDAARHQARGRDRAFESSGLQLAIREAGSNRFRPILLTSLTTFFGLVPLMLERSMQAAFLVPMAVSLAFGVIFATFITLILVPVSYLILDDVQRTLQGLFGSEHAAGPPEANDAGAATTAGTA